MTARQERPDQNSAERPSTVLFTGACLQPRPTFLPIKRMANAAPTRIRGDDYQVRIFWIEATPLFADAGIDIVWDHLNAHRAAPVQDYLSRRPQDF